MEAIDLNLTSGLRWADCNVGSKKETDPGLYFQFGDITGYRDASHSTDATCPGGFDWGENNIVNGVLKPGADAACVHLGGDWRLPSPDEINELICETVIEVSVVEGVKGMRFISKSDHSKSIFVPFSGVMFCKALLYKGIGGLLWSNSLCGGQSAKACRLLISDKGVASLGSDVRFLSVPVRAVI